MERRLVFMALGLMVVALALSIQLLRENTGALAAPAASLDAIYDHYLAATRIMTGALLVLGWPAVLHASARMLRLRFRRPGYFLTLAGILLGAMTYCLTFLPWPGLGAVLVLPGAAAFALFFFVLRLPLRRGIALWLVQGALALGLFTSTFWGIESLAAGHALNPAREAPAIYRFARFAALQEQQIAPDPRENAFPILVWPSTGSRWLDHRANLAQITVRAAGERAPWRIELRARGSAEPEVTAESAGASATTPVFNPRPDTGYTLSVARPGALNGDDIAKIHGLVPVNHTGGD